MWATSGSKFQINNSTVKGSLVSFFLSSVNLKNSTIAGGGYVSGGSNNITLDNSIWTGINLNQIPDTNLVKVKYSILGNSLYGSSKYNVVSTTIPTYTSWLEPLADNGGLIPTMKLKNAPNNPAKSNGNPIYLGTADQRGIIRTDSASIGAYQYIKATDVAITPKQVTLCQGDSISFNVSVSPAFVSDNSYLATSSNSSIAYVANSKIHAFAPGNVDIFIQTNDGGLRDTCKVVVMAPVGSGTIAGATTVCKDQKSVTYTATGFSNAISYVWALPEGATGSSTASSIAVDFSDIAASGNISVKGQNVCGDGEISGLAITVNQYPTAAGAISGASNVCQGQNAVAYSVAPIADAKTYIWNLPTGATETSATNSILMDYGTSTVSGAISVKGNNSCGDGDVSDLPITVYSIPVTPQINLAGSILQSNATSGNQWYNQNGLIPGATNQDYTVTENGEYFTLVTLMNCSSDTSNMISVLNTGIEITDHKKTIQVYPNPVSNELTIEMEGNKGKINFEVINALGEVLLNGNFIEKTTVWMGNFAPGIYIIKLENGKITEIKKIIKE